MRLEPGEGVAMRPVPAARADSKRAAEDEKAQHQAEVATWVYDAKRKLDALEPEFRRQLREQPPVRRAGQRTRFDRDRRQRLAALDRMAEITVSEPLPIGWVQVSGAGSLADMGTDPNSEKIAICACVKRAREAGLGTAGRLGA